MISNLVLNFERKCQSIHYQYFFREVTTKPYMFLISIKEKVLSDI